MITKTRLTKIVDDSFDDVLHAQFVMLNTREGTPSGYPIPPKQTFATGLEAAFKAYQDAMEDIDDFVAKAQTSLRVKTTLVLINTIGSLQG